MFGSHPSRWIIFLIGGALTALGCVGSTDTGGQGETGSLSVDLVLADGIEIDEVDWQITGNGMDMSGGIDVSAPGSTASVEVFGLPPGATDYTVTLRATSTDESVTCEGSAPFNVEVGEATEVMVMLNCKKPRVLGGVRVNGKFNICAQLTKVVVSPLQTSVGNDISLSAQAFDEEGDAITFSWTGDGGSIADPTAASTTYTCGTVGDHSVTIRVTDNDQYCDMATWTVPVTCVEGDGGNLCDDVECMDDGNECTETACNQANGECETSNVEDGTECDGGTCAAGVCVEDNLCDGVDCSDGNECTADACDPADASCSNSNVDNGTPCNDDTGMCVDGSCMDSDLCEGVTCDDTGNDCTVAMCNMANGICETMNVTDGTECNGGAGACSAGDCIDSSLCDGVDCTSSNDCVQDGSCDPADGNCIAGDNQPADTACADGGTVCDGAGNCVECNSAGQCADDGNECTAAACEGNACAQNNVMDGQVCDFGGSDGICEAGTCVEAPGCTSDAQCDDGNPCTAGTCPDGMCVFTPVDGGACEVSAGVPGTCSAGSCVGLCDGVDCTSAAQCVEDGTCDDQTGSCVAGANEAADTACTEGGGSVCDGAGACVECNSDAQCAANEACVSNSCEASATACGTQGQTVQIGCTNGVTTAQSPFPNQMSITVNEPVLANQSFTVDASGVGAFPKFFLDAAQGTVPGGVRSAVVEGFNATVELTNGTGAVLLQADPSGISPGLTQFCQYPSSTVCTSAADCIVPPCNPPVLLAAVPISEDCSVGGFCDSIGQGPGDGATAQCNITDPPSFCVTGDLNVPLFAPGGPQSVTAGASGDVVFNWAVDPSTEVCGAGSTSSRCEANGGTLPDRALILPASVYGDPVNNPASVGLNGIRLNVANALFVALQCSAGSDGGACAAGTNAGLGCAGDGECPGSTCVGVGVDDDIIVATPEVGLIKCPIN